MTKPIEALADVVRKKSKGSQDRHVSRIGTDVGKAIPFEPANYIPSVFFIDGGQGELYSTPSFNVSIMKIAYVSYDRLTKIGGAETTFYLVVNTEGKPAFFTASLIPIEDGCNITKELDEMVSEIKMPLRDEKGQKMSSEIASNVRRLAELKLTEKLAMTADAGTMIVLDGHLEGYGTAEKHLLKKMNKIGRDVLITSLAKQSNMLTDDGESVLSVLGSLEPGKCWYHPPGRIKDGPMVSFVKLNPKSEFVFKFEMLTEEENFDIQRIACTLGSHSLDAIFPGYPYGLIKVDQMARISNQETEYQRTLFASTFGTEWKEVKTRIAVPDAHKVLDSIS